MSCSCRLFSHRSCSVSSACCLSTRLPGVESPAISPRAMSKRNMTRTKTTTRNSACAAVLFLLLLVCSTLHDPVDAFSFPQCRVVPRQQHARTLFSSCTRLSETSAADDAFEKIFVNEQSTKLSSQSKETYRESPVVPSYKAILLFVSTTILIWLSEPLLSLVDTTVVGQQSNAVMQMAALGPATMLIDSLVYLTYFLSIATTSTISKALAEKDTRKLQKTSSQIMGIATALGVLVTLIVYTVGKPLLTWMAGTSASPQLVALALEYSQIRCAVAPLSILGMVAQSICLACLDTRTPAIAVAVASVVNVVGDLYLVKVRGMGLAGAALATAAASVASTLVLLQQVKRKTGQWKTANTLNGNGAIGRTAVVNGTPILNTTTPSTGTQQQNKTDTTIQATTRPANSLYITSRSGFLSEILKTGWPHFLCHCRKSPLLFCHDVENNQLWSRVHCHAQYHDANLFLSRHLWRFSISSGTNLFASHSHSRYSARRAQLVEKANGHCHVHWSVQLGCRAKYFDALFTILHLECRPLRLSWPSTRCLLHWRSCCILLSWSWREPLLPPMI